MYRIDRNDNAITPLQSRKFSDLGFQERRHLQEWIAKHPSCLGEDLLILQKEFAGFSDTQERLDLLALDKEGRLVIIENKLDDTGRDVTWQAMKYASYCAGLKTENIRSIFHDYLRRQGHKGDAAELIAEFLGVDDLSDIALNKGFTQRIILIAANFRKEVTSTVLWLANFGLQVHCFKVTPWSYGDELFLNVDQIIPTPDAQEFVIGLADKARDEAKAVSAEVVRHSMRHEYWVQYLEVLNRKTRLYANLSPSTGSWIGAGLNRMLINSVALQGKSRVELYINRGNREANKAVYDLLYPEKDAIEAEIGAELDWDRKDDKETCRIMYQIPGDVSDRSSWPLMIETMSDALVRLEKAMVPRLNRIGERLRTERGGKE